MPIIPGTREAMLALSNAEAALNVARKRGFKIDRTVEQAEQRRRTFMDLAVKPDVKPKLMDDTPPSKIEDVLVRYAADQRAVEDVRGLAERLRPGADEQVIETVRTQVSDWVAKLVPTFAGTLDTFRAAAPGAPNVGPDRLAGLGANAFAAWRNVSDIAVTLDELVADRITFGQTANENPHHQWHRTLATFARVAPPPENKGLAQREFSARAERFRAVDETPDPATRWRALCDLEQAGWIRLALAGPGQIAVNVGSIHAWQNALDAVFTRDGGKEYAAIRHGATVGWVTIHGTDTNEVVSAL